MTPETNEVLETSTISKSPVGGSHPTRSATARWGGEPEIFADGYLSVPTKFLRGYALLDPPLTPGEALFVLQLMTFKWDTKAPFPAYKRISTVMGVSDKMARRYAQGLEKKGYLRRRFQERAPNQFDLSGLFETLADVTKISPKRRRERANEAMKGEIWN